MYKQVISMSQLANYQHEYTALVKVSQPGADILDRIGVLEQTFDLIDMGEILVEETSDVG